MISLNSPNKTKSSVIAVSKSNWEASSVINQPTNTCPSLTGSAGLLTFSPSLTFTSVFTPSTIKQTVNSFSSGFTSSNLAVTVTLPLTASKS